MNLTDVAGGIILGILTAVLTVVVTMVIIIMFEGKNQRKRGR